MQILRMSKNKFSNRLLLDFTFCSENGRARGQRTSDFSGLLGEPAMCEISGAPCGSLAVPNHPVRCCRIFVWSSRGRALRITRAPWMCTVHTFFFAAICVHRTCVHWAAVQNGAILLQGVKGIGLGPTVRLKGPQGCLMASLCFSVVFVV